MTLTTRIYTLFCGQLAGSDAFGNRYYRRRGRTHGDSSVADKRRKEKRWVIYKGIAEPSKVPPEWHGWLHYTFDTPPPPLEPGGPYDLSADRRYAGVAIPSGESLKDTIARVLPYWEERIAPALRAGQRVLIAAHGNSLRALVKHLSAIPDAEITGLEIPTGQPIVYELDEALKPVDRYYLSER